MIFPYSLEDENYLLKQRIQQLEEELAASKRRIESMTKKITDFQQGKLPKNVKRKVVLEALKNQFSEAQIKIFLSGAQNYRSKNYTDQKFR